MGKDKTWDKNATATENKDQESRDATLAKTIATAVAVALAQQKAEETQSIAEAVALQSKSNPSQKHSQGKWRRCMRSMKSF